MSELADWLSDTHPITRKNAAEVVFDDIRSAITSGRLAVGTRLPSEAQLAGRFGVSRPIVREALRSLQTLGLTQTRTGSGTYVLNTSPVSELSYGGYSARDLIEARPFIEVPAAGWAALRRSAGQLAHLLELCDKMDRQTDPQKWELLDSEFHCAIAEASGNTVFSKIVADAREALIQQSELVNLMSGRREASNVEHRRIVEAIEAGSEAEARAAMEAHLSKVKTAVTTIIGKDEV
ncbi:FadR family transcriptional regulator [Brucella tritici]|uniref:FadR family transcriptional regulator n=1 Tax=Brucella tritici TaxID=94626 RepID=A0A6L3YTT4_9HYPH|nr:FadR/GntR family transcriptional regulator [Brucella tritici]KAB2664409.1 FadR family transcriptional regulator [Brucella tritici]KAB2676634.1 FadR family transcriptional regulator [Brucella tritici]KAB2687080.1 FadR family transcriptional regulator [Brucella tritici]MBJ6719366.1 FadR family transcriptional regulator [Bacillus sp. PR5]